MTMRAEIRLPSNDLHEDLPFYESLGFRLEEIWPADDPAVALISGHGLRVRLARDAGEAPGTIRLLSDDEPRAPVTSPGGVRVEFAPLQEPMPTPPTAHRFMTKRLTDADPWIIGRAGMNYRDLIPDRLGGAIIASHIRILDEGPVPDMVHYHTVGFQLIFCHAGWVDLVYEDQGPPFRLSAGDCVIQPPEIRHRVLHSSDNLEVIEIGVPAEHVTTIDHDMELPTPDYRPEREFGGQVFVHHKEAEATWSPWRLPGWTHRDTGIGEGTRGVAGVHISRPGSEPDVRAAHDCDILFTFLRAGAMSLRAEGEADTPLKHGDAFVTPPGMAVEYADPSEDLELLEVALAADFVTSVI
ncbi:MAG: cupin [Pseudomonadota bacterium]